MNNKIVARELVKIAKLLMAEKGKWVKWRDTKGDRLYNYMVDGDSMATVHLSNKEFRDKNINYKGSGFKPKKGEQDFTVEYVESYFDTKTKEWRWVGKNQSYFTTDDERKAISEFEEILRSVPKKLNKNEQGI